MIEAKGERMTEEKIFLALFKPEHFIGSCDLDDVDMVELTKEEIEHIKFKVGWGLIGTLDQETLKKLEKLHVHMKK